MWVSAAAPVLTPVPLGTGGGDEKDKKHEHTLKNQLRFQGGKSQREGFPYSFQTWGRSPLWCWSEAELLCRSQHLCSSCLWGSSVISTPSLGFSRELSHSAYCPSALLKELRHFQRSQRSSLAGLDIYTCMFLSEDRGMACSAGKSERSEFCFLFESFRAHFLRPMHNLKNNSLFINSLTNPIAVHCTLLLMFLAI